MHNLFYSNSTNQPLFSTLYNIIRGTSTWIILYMANESASDFVPIIKYPANFIHISSPRIRKINNSTPTQPNPKQLKPKIKKYFVQVLRNHFAYQVTCLLRSMSIILFLTETARPSSCSEKYSLQQRHQHQRYLAI